MSAYVIFIDKLGKTLTVPACVEALSYTFRGRVKYVGTFWASNWEEARETFDRYFGFI